MIVDRSFAGVHTYDLFVFLLTGRHGRPWSIGSLRNAFIACGDLWKPGWAMRDGASSSSRYWQNENFTVTRPVVLELLLPILERKRAC
jgi:hypothetical protein